MSWLFQVIGDGSRVMDLASQGAAKLILNPGAGAPGLVMGDSFNNQAANNKITNLAYATDDLDACPLGQTKCFIQDAVNELV